MAKITTITNPLTGQPAQVDQLDHTAQQIDDAIARALPGGAIDIALQNKLPKSGGTMSGAIAMDSNKITGLGSPTDNADAATKGYTDTLVKTRRIYTAFGNLIKSEGGTLLGTGIATVTIDPNGLARIDFSIDITSSGSKADVWFYGISESLLHERNPNIPIITPITGGVINWYRYPEMTYMDSLAIYAAFPAAEGGYWRIARVHTSDGVWGDYPESCLTKDQRIIGTCYGIVEL